MIEMLHPNPLPDITVKRVPIDKSVVIAYQQAAGV